MTTSIAESDRMTVPDNIGFDPGKVPARNGLRLYLLVALGLHCLFALYYVTKSKAFAFADIGSDTFSCFYPLQVAVAHQLKTLHEVTWSFELGIGGFIASIFDPLWLVVGWFPDSWQLALRLPMFIFRSVLGGAFFFGYFRILGVRAQIAVMAGLGYAFSSYAMINAQWEVLHGTEFMQLSAYLFLLELFLRRGSRFAAIAAGVTIGLGHPLGMYMFALFTLLYVTARIFVIGRAESVGSTVRAVVIFGLWCVLGLAITAPLLLPATYYLLESPRVSGSYLQLHAILSLLFSVNDKVSIASEITGLLGKDFLGTNLQYHGWLNYFEGPAFYVGLLPLLCIPQLIGPTSRPACRRLSIIALVCIGLYFIFPGLRYLVYGFGHMAFRFSTLWISVLLLTMGLLGLRQMLASGPWRPGILLAVAGIFGIIIAANIFAPTIVNNEHVVRVAVFTLAYGVLLWYLADPAWRARALVPLLAVMCCELAMFSMPAVLERTPVGADGSSPSGNYDDPDTVKSLTLIRNIEGAGNFYRVEKTFDSVFLDDAMIQDYAGTKSYYFHAASISRFVDGLGLPRFAPFANYISSMASRPDILDLLAVKYLISRDRSLDKARGLTHIATMGGDEIYRNNNAFDFGHFFDRVSDEKTANGIALLLERDAFLLKSVVFADSAPVQAALDAEDAGSSSSRDLPAKVDVRKTRDDLLQGTVQTPKKQVLLIPMPFDRGWKIYLDDEVATSLQADYGLTAIVVPAGTHRITMTYIPPGRTLGIWLSAAALCIVGVFQFWSRVRLPRRDQE